MGGGLAVVLGAVCQWPAVLAADGVHPMIVAHRGASHDAPENTLPAFRLAWEQGADAIEGDFYLTKDGQIVCTHDAVTGRLNPGKVKLGVAKSTLAELQALDVGVWKGEAWKGERMPTLAQVLEVVPDGKRILIEVKCGKEIIPALKAELAASSLKPEQVVIISFQQAVILEAKRELPQLEAFWLMSFSRVKETGALQPSRAEIVETLARVQADGLSCGNHDSLAKDLLEEVSRAGCECHCWTVDDPARARELAAMGMRSITTNRPAAIRAALGVGQEPPR